MSAVTIYNQYVEQFNYAPKQAAHLQSFAKSNGIKLTYAQCRDAIKNGGNIPEAAPSKNESKPISRPSANSGISNASDIYGAYKPPNLQQTQPQQQSIPNQEQQSHATQPEQVPPPPAPPAQQIQANNPYNNYNQYNPHAQQAQYNQYYAYNNQQQPMHGYYNNMYAQQSPYMQHQQYTQYNQQQYIPPPPQQQSPQLPQQQPYQQSQAANTASNTNTQVTQQQNVDSTNKKFAMESVVKRQISPVQKVQMSGGDYDNMADNELNEKLEIMMDKMGLPENAKDTMRNQTRQQKTQMLLQFDRQQELERQQYIPQSKNKSPKLGAKIEAFKQKAKETVDAYLSDKDNDGPVEAKDIEVMGTFIKSEGKYSDISEVQLSKKMESMMKVMNIPENTKDSMRNQSREQKIQMILTFEEQFFAKEEAERKREKEKKSLKYKLTVGAKKIRTSMKSNDGTLSSPKGTKSPKSPRRKLFRLGSNKQKDAQ